MKLDKIRFATLIGYISRITNQTFAVSEINEIDDIIDLAIPEPPMMNATDLHTLMALMHEGTRKVEAIKQHRMMTGYGLKESKDIVDKYWPDKSGWSGWTKNEMRNKVNLLMNADDAEAVNSFIDAL